MSTVRNAVGRIPPALVWALVGVSLVIVFLLTAMVVLRIANGAAAPGHAARRLPPDYARLPDFSLTECNGATVGRDDLLGAPVVFSFIFTRCHHTCPNTTAVMRQLREALPDDIQLVTLTVDPRYDRPSVLKRYAANFDADGRSWWFLTGERDDVYDLIREGFKVSVMTGDDPRILPETLVSHTPRLVVLDSRARIRGYIDSQDPDALRAVQDRISELKAEAK